MNVAATHAHARVAAETARNPGPSWGYQVLRGVDRILPEPVFRPLRAAGTWVAVALMPRQRRHSRAYLEVVLGRGARWRDVFRHFFAFEETLMLKLRAANGRSHECALAPGTAALAEWLQHGGPVLLGTFHVGTSDLLGFLVGERWRRHTVLVRLRVKNTHDTEALGARFARWVRFVWVNDPAEMLFALKDAAGAADAIALQCDRAEFSARSEHFAFLGARRRFPFAIYHLAIVLQRPVFLAVGIPGDARRTTVHASPKFETRPDEPRAEALARARDHFQQFLHELESLLRQHPELWFNFRPLDAL